jgi:hypothetical protein
MLGFVVEELCQDFSVVSFPELRGFEVGEKSGERGIVWVVRAKVCVVLELLDKPSSGEKAPAVREVDGILKDLDDTESQELWVVARFQRVLRRDVDLHRRGHCYLRPSLRVRSIRYHGHPCNHKLIRFD